MLSYDDLSKTVSSLVKFNDGVWKSVKQRDYFIKSAKNNPYACFDPIHAGITTDNATFTFIGETRWASYGSRSIRPYGFVFEYDAKGVVRKWKLRWQGDMRSGTSVDPTRTELVWERPEGLNTDHLVEIAKEEPSIPESKYLADVGEKVEAIVEVLFKKEFFSRFGRSNLVKMRTAEGSDVTTFTSSDVEQLAVGSKVKVAGKVKALEVYNNRRQTILTRVKFAEIV